MSQVEDAPSSPIPWRRALPVLLTILVIADIVAAVEQSMVLAAFKAIVEDTGDTIGAGWLISAYFVVAGPAAVIAGRLGDMYGRKQVLLAVLGLVLAGSLVSAFSDHMLGIIIGRGIQGVSGAILPLCIGICRENLGKEKLGLGLGILLSAHAIGTLIGVVLGGVIVDLTHWHMIFIVAAALALLVLVLVLVFTPSSSQRTPQRLDWLGLGAAPAIGCLLFGISAFNSPTLSVSTAIAITGVGLVLMALWATHELRHDTPLVDLRLLKSRDIGLSNVTSVVTSIGPGHLALYFMALAQQPVWTGAGFGLSASAAGAWMAPFVIVAAVLAPCAGYLTTRWGPQRVILLGTVLQVVGWTVVIFQHHSFWPFMMMMFVCSAGAMIINVGITGTVTLASPQDRTGEAIGTVTVTRSFGNAVGSQLIALLFSLSLVVSPDHPGKTFPAPSGHMLTLGMFLLCALGALGIALCLRRTPWRRGRIA